MYLFVVADNQSAMAEQGLLQMLSQRLAACVKEDEALQACEAIFAAIYEHGKHRFTVSIRP